ncbi:MAG TPA: hypothetical protein VFX18_03590 [Candidatus Nitrosocosmicus sp.]|nr:hypothetical protein [Candidatus Nitrosocosmicus sp.]
MNFSFEEKEGNDADFEEDLRNDIEEEGLAEDIDDGFSEDTSSDF